MDEIQELARLIQARNRVAAEIAALIGRPAQIDHVGEFIAARLFAIQLEPTASQKAIDGYFTQGPLAGRSINVKWYAKREGMLDLTPEALPDFYLVLTGPRMSEPTSRGGVRPWLIDAVYLFEAAPLVADLRDRGLRHLGIATSVRQALWKAAEVYPNQRNPQLLLTDAQRRQLALFGSPVP